MSAKKLEKRNIILFLGKLSGVIYFIFLFSFFFLNKKFIYVCVTIP
jgi:hypothetical protein